MKFLSQFIHKVDALDRLRTSTAQLDALVREIRAALPAAARDHVVGCAVRPGLLIVFADSAAWATQLRYLQQDILLAGNEVLGNSARRLQFKVLPPTPVAGNPPGPGLSKNTRRLLNGAASGVADEELAAALRRLSDAGDQDAD